MTRWIFPPPLLFGANHFLRFSRYSVLLGYVIFSSFVTGCAVVIVALQQKRNLSLTFHRINEHLGLIAETKSQPIDCNVCGRVKCNRHLVTPNREPWRGLFITRGLDTALDSVREVEICSRKAQIFSSSTTNFDRSYISVVYLQFYTKILNAFVESWFSLLSKNEDFVTALKHILREATCRLILKFEEVCIREAL